MGLMDFLNEAYRFVSDLASSETAQKLAEKQYRSGRASEEKYEKYLDAVNEYKSRKAEWEATRNDE